MYAARKAGQSNNQLENELPRSGLVHFEVSVSSIIPDNTGEGADHAGS